MQPRQSRGGRSSRARVVPVWAAVVAASTGVAWGGQLPRATETPLLPPPGLDALELALQQDRVDAPLELPGPRRGGSVYKAAFLSALVPGLGEYYSGHKNRAVLFGTLEGGIWIAYATFKVQEDLRRERSVEFAVATAGALPGGDDDYYSAIAQFLRSDGPGQWNEFVRRRRRDTGEVVGVEYRGDAGWAWPSVEHFSDYRNLRRRQLQAEDYATNMLAVALVNRIASVVDVVQAMRSGSTKAEKEETFGLKLQLGRTPGEPLARLVLQNRF
ncbi:MAG: hypothetical protein ACE5G2_00310 [Candidatus Krumholzibacteriia bacterium]